MSIDENLKIDLILFARRDESVEKAFAKDPRAEIYIQKIDFQAIQLLNQEYPNYLTGDLDEVFCVNITSSKMVGKQGYRKIRLYMKRNGDIIKRLETPNEN
jgi:hypothetical protein